MADKMPALHSATCTRTIPSLQFDRLTNCIVVGFLGIRDMLRWLILLTTLALWLTCMVTIYGRFQPSQAPEVLFGAQETLFQLFDERTERRREWRLFVDVERLKELMRLPSDSGAVPRRSHEPWNGVDEKKLCEIGHLQTILKSRHATRIEQTVEMMLKLPAELNHPLLQMFEHVQMKIRADISLDKGLETFNSRSSMGLGFEITACGFREGENLSIMQQIWQNGRQLLSRRHQIPMGQRTAPSLELLPFQPQPNIRKGLSWDLAILDTSASLSGAAQAKTVALQVTCTGKEQIFMADKLVMAFVVSTEDGSVRAWYSADGVVLKQVYNLFELDVIAVRQDVKIPGGGRLHKL
ncbi:MAG: hypothetical protein V1899_11720 [Planctomycetota bacterium]